MIAGLGCKIQYGLRTQAAVQVIMQQHLGSTTNQCLRKWCITARIHVTFGHGTNLA